MSSPKTIAALYMSGTCRNGFQRDAGRLAHAVEFDDVQGGGWTKALCGARPGYAGNGWSAHVQPAVTCPRCLARLARAFAAIAKGSR